jgi:hypothetical protein
MSKRLQVLMELDELTRVQGAAELEGMTVAAWVRRAIKRALHERTEHAPDRKIAAVREAARHAFPAPEIEQMLAEIERGRITDLPL